MLSTALILATTGANQSGENVASANATSEDEDEKLIDDLEVSKDKYDPWDSDEELEISFELKDDAEVDVKIYKKSSNELIYELEDDEDLDDGDHYYDWNGENKDGEKVKEGTYKVKVIAENDEGEKDVDTITFKIKKGAEDETDDPRLKDVFVSKASFDPGLSEKAYIAFTLTSEADVEINILDDEEYVVAELYDKSNVDAGTYVYGWNGENDNAKLVGGNATYTYEIKVENEKGDDKATGEIEVKNDDEVSKKANVYKDKTSPVVFEPDGEKEIKFEFKLSKDADVTLEIYDDGKVFAEVFDGELDSGSNKIDWNGRNEEGELITDGVYDYKIISENYKGKSIEYGKFIVQNSDDKVASSASSASVASTASGTSSTSGTSGKCANFKDLSSADMYCEAIAWAKENGIFKGNSKGEIEAYNSINRVEAIKAILEAFDVELIEGYYSNFGYTDVQPGSWYAEYIQTAQLNGIAQGYQDGTFKPGSKVVRAEALVMALNAAQVKGKAKVSYCTSKPYTDVEIGVWYTSAICYSKQHDLLPAYESQAYGNYFLPMAELTRGDMANLLYSFYKEGIL